MWERERVFPNCCELSKIDEELFFSTTNDKEKGAFQILGRDYMLINQMIK